MHELATKAWDAVVKLGEKNGFRNAQASVLAPTGTIGFMMDCDTTGIEPDFSLVKFKKLVGGGSMQIVNQTIPRALKKLGYAEETIEAIVEYIAEHGHVIDAPGLKTEHYEVFDTAMGARALAPMGHVRMMAAAQPFLSGAISKTVNLPETATVEEIEDVYLQCWKLGLKATRGLPRQLQGRPAAVRRARRKGADKAYDAAEAAASRGQRYGRRAPDPQAAAEVAPVAHHVVHRRRRRGLHDRRLLPRRRPRRGVPQARQAGLDPGRRDGRLLDGDLDRPAVRRPAGDLRLEVHQHEVRARRPHRRPGRPDGQSIMDYIFRRLALDYLPFEKRLRARASTPPRSASASSRPAPTSRQTRRSPRPSR